MAMITISKKLAEDKGLYATSFKAKADKGMKLLFSQYKYLKSHMDKVAMVFTRKGEEITYTIYTPNGEIPDQLSQRIKELSC